MPDGSMAHFGAGGSGVGAKTLALALAEQRPVIAVVRNAQVAAGLQEKGVQVFIGDACDSRSPPVPVAQLVNMPR